MDKLALTLHASNVYIRVTGEVRRAAAASSAGGGSGKSRSPSRTVVAAGHRSGPPESKPNWARSPAPATRGRDRRSGSRAGRPWSNGAAPNPAGTKRGGRRRAGPEGGGEGAGGRRRGRCSRNGGGGGDGADGPPERKKEKRSVAAALVVDSLKSRHICRTMVKSRFS